MSPLGFSAIAGHHVLILAGGLGGHDDLFDVRQDNLWISLPQFRGEPQ